MKNAYRLFRRNNKFYYLENNHTGIQKSLGTDDMAEAEKLLNAANDDPQAADLNLNLGKTYLAHADPTAAKRTWHYAIDELASRGKASTQQRYAREFRSNRPRDNRIKMRFVFMSSWRNGRLNILLS